MRKKTSKFLSGLLAVLMLFTSVPMTAYATEEATDNTEVTRVLVKGDESVIDEDAVIGQIGDTYLLQYDTKSEAIETINEVEDKADFAYLDEVFMVAEDGSEEIPSDIPMTAEENPLNELSDALDSMPKGEVENLIALIDTGVNGYESNVIEKVSMPQLSTPLNAALKSSTFPFMPRRHRSLRY